MALVIGNWSLTEAKNFRITEGQNVQFRVEAFNWRDHPNWCGVGTNPRNPTTLGKVSTDFRCAHWSRGNREAYLALTAIRRGW